MPITVDDAIHITKLAKVELTPEQIKALAVQLSSVANYMQQLNQLDTENVPPTFHVHNNAAWLRKDKVNLSLSIEKVLANAPAHNEESFIVPQII